MNNKDTHINQQKNPIIRYIKEQGPISVAQYMYLALQHPKYGYYTNKNPFNGQGDFVTAPEISQIFGEIIALFCRITWKNYGQPKKWNIIECGPGNGTLIGDILRTLQKLIPKESIPGVHLVEISPVLTERQKQNLKKYNTDINNMDIKWHHALGDVFQNNNQPPFILIANEFFDVLETEQFIYHHNQWWQRTVACLPDNTLTFTKRKITNMITINPSQAPKQNDILEISPKRKQYMQNIAEAVQKYKGTALIIDYGYKKTAYGDTLQALSKHQYCDALQNPGKCDLTTHVNFEELQNTAQKQKSNISNILTQSQFIKALGGEIRAEKLKQNTSKKNKEMIQNQILRLIQDQKPHHMGALFKTLCITHQNMKLPFPFSMQARREAHI